MKSIHRILLLSASVVTLGMFAATQAAAFDDDLGLIGDEDNDSIGAALRICELPSNAAENIRENIFCDVEVQNELPALVDERSRNRACNNIFRMCRNTAATHRQCHQRTINQEAAILRLLSPATNREINSEARDCRRLASDLNRDERQRTGDQDNSLCTNQIRVNGQFDQCINCGQLETYCNGADTFNYAVDCNLDFCFSIDPEVPTGFLCDPGRFGYCVEGLDVGGDQDLVDPELICDTGWNGDSDSCRELGAFTCKTFNLGRCNVASDNAGDICDSNNDCPGDGGACNFGDPASDAYCSVAGGVPSFCAEEVGPDPM